MIAIVPRRVSLVVAQLEGRRLRDEGGGRREALLERTVIQQRLDGAGDLPLGVQGAVVLGFRVALAACHGQDMIGEWLEDDLSLIHI